MNIFCKKGSLLRTQVRNNTNAVTRAWKGFTRISFIVKIRNAIRSPNRKIKSPFIYILYIIHFHIFYGAVLGISRKYQ